MSFLQKTANDKASNAHHANSQTAALQFGGNHLGHLEPEGFGSLADAPEMHVQRSDLSIYFRNAWPANPNSNLIGPSHFVFGALQAYPLRIIGSPEAPIRTVAPSVSLAQSIRPAPLMSLQPHSPPQNQPGAENGILDGGKQANGSGASSDTEDSSTDGLSEDCSSDEEKVESEALEPNTMNVAGSEVSVLADEIAQVEEKVEEDENMEDSEKDLPTASEETGKNTELGKDTFSHAVQTPEEHHPESTTDSMGNNNLQGQEMAPKPGDS
ncbi:hypothetical protein R1flu_027127 [Riccia fluitans]|uniref:Uncharacterized protein n=1 Tax=Riccia fluitans TaxID=41844 RepID=A0ABD1XHX8_9MARC